MSRFPLRRYSSSARRPSAHSSNRDSAWLSVTGCASFTPTIVASGARAAVTPSGQIAWAQAVLLQAQVVVLLRLTDPLHAHPLHHRGGSGVGRPDERDDLLYALVERPPGQRQPGLGGVPMTPLLPVKLPA